MNYKQTVHDLDNETIDKLREAVELGKWENGDKLTNEQRESAMQAVMIWQAKNEVTRDNEPFKVNNKGEFSIGKGTKLSDTPIEFKSKADIDLIFSSKS